MKDAEIKDFSHVADALNKAANLGHHSSFEIDLDHYQRYLDDPNLTADQKTEIITALWSIISAFVELGFGVHPAQQACGKRQKSLDYKGKSESTESNQNEKDPDLDVPAI